MDQLLTLLDRSAQRHSHLCPRQVLGVRMGMLAGTILELDLPQKDKRLFTFAESDGCGTGGISVATGCWVDRRTLRVMDFGKMAATFVDTQTGRAIRISPEPTNREKAKEYAPDALSHWHSMLVAYQILEDKELFIVQGVQITVSMEKIISQPGLRVSCEGCGEEISNEREVLCDGLTLCRYCAGERYYEPDSYPLFSSSDIHSFVSLIEKNFSKYGHDHV